MTAAFFEKSDGFAEAELHCVLVGAGVGEHLTGLEHIPHGHEHLVLVTTTARMSPRRAVIRR